MRGISNCIDTSVFKIWWHWLKSATDDFSNDKGVGMLIKFDSNVLLSS